MGLPFFNGGINPVNLFENHELFVACFYSRPCRTYQHNKGEERGQ